VPKPGEKYFKGRVYRNGKMIPYVVWDGVRGYENTPPPTLLIAEQLTGNIGIVQIGKKANNIHETTDVLTAAFDSLVLWTRDHEVYRWIVDKMMARSSMWMQ
jgi:hypothetical protein